MTIHTITQSEKEKVTGQACELFKVRHRAFFPCLANSDKLVAFVESQLGMTIDEFPYPVTVDQWTAAYEHIEATSWFYERPEEVEFVDEAVLREQAAQQKVRADYDARQAAEKRQRDKAMPLSELGAKVSQQNAQFREARDRNELPVRQPGTESRSLATVTFGLKATARNNVAMANPSLDRNGEAFARLYAAELSRLRS